MAGESSSGGIPAVSSGPQPSGSSNSESSLSSFSSGSSGPCKCSVELDINYVKLIAGDFVTGIAKTDTDCEIIPTPFVNPADCTEVLYEGCISFSYTPREEEYGSEISFFAGTQPQSHALGFAPFAANAAPTCTPSMQSVTIAIVESISGVDENAYCLNAEITVTALLTGGVTPEFGVQWGGDAEFQEIDNVTAKARLTSSGKNLRITATIGAQKTPVTTETFTVVDRKCDVPDSAEEITILPIRKEETTVPPGNAGATTTMDFDTADPKGGSPFVEIDAFCDCDAGVWRCRIISAKVRTFQTFRYPNNDVYTDIRQASNQTPPNCFLLRAMSNWLEQAIGNAAQVAMQVTPPAAIRAHENVHVEHLNEAYPQAYTVLRDAIDELSVDLAQFATAEEAKEWFKTRPAFQDARSAFRDRVADLVEPSFFHRPPGPFLEVHARYLGPILRYVNRVISQVCK